MTRLGSSDVLDAAPAIAASVDEDERQVVPDPLVRCAGCGVSLRPGDGAELLDGTVLCLDDARRERRGTAAAEEIARGMNPRRSS